MGAEALVQSGCCDPIRVFVKNEPHSLSKCREGRWRLIMSVSIVDQLVERVLCGEMNEWEIANFERLPAKPGMGFSDDLVELVGDNLQALSDVGVLSSSDVSGWDWSVSGEQLRADALRRIRFFGVAMDHPYAVILLNRVTCLGRSVVSFSDGTLVAQRVDGVQKSGSYNTSSTNSWIRAFVAEAAGASSAITMGDDCVDSGCSADLVSRMGHPVKEYAVVDAADPAWVSEVQLAGELDEFSSELLRSCAWLPFDSSLAPRAEFCSHFWCQDRAGGWCAIYKGWRKSLVNLLHQRREKELHFREFVALMQRSPALPHAVQLLREMGWFDSSFLSRKI